MLNTLSSAHYVAFLFLLASLLLNFQLDTARDVVRLAGSGARRVLLLTAHPDDECMFFGPTLLALTDNAEDHTSANVFSLCLSSGDADGLGETRKRELNASLDVLGIGGGKRLVLDEPFKDNITEFWSAEIISKYVSTFVLEHDIDTILTFDQDGVSSHPNHISLYYGAREVISSLRSRKPGLRAFGLRTTSLISKYTGTVSAFAAQIEHAACMQLPEHILSRIAELSTLSPIHLTLLDCARYEFTDAGGETETLYGDISPAPRFVSNWERYFRTLRAMLRHESQLVWFRWLYVAFSRYLWVNEWEEIRVGLSDR